MTLLVELISSFGRRYIFLDTPTDRYTDEYFTLEDLLTYYKGVYRYDSKYSSVELPAAWKETKYDVSTIDLTDVTTALLLIYEKYPELLL